MTAPRRKRPRLHVVEEQQVNPIALCKNRSIGHDWAGGTTRWEEGGRLAGRTKVYETYAITDCPRCGTLKTEIFEQHGELYVVKLRNRYRYTPAWHEFPAMTQVELQTARWRQQSR